MLDIGDDVGALVLITDASLVGAEIEVSPLGRSDLRTHAEVHPRRAGGDTLHAAIFVRLLAGPYTVWRPHGEAWGIATIEGGKVAQLNRRTAAAV
jgi:hypothetical protein